MRWWQLHALVRGGAVVPTGPSAQGTMGLDRGDWVLHLWPGPVRTTTVHDPEGLCRYRPVDARGGEPAAPEQVAAVAAEEPVPRAAEVRLHLPDGTLRTLPVQR